MRALASGIPSTGALTYSGVLEDSGGPVNGSHNIQVIVYDAVTAGNSVCQSSPTSTPITDGHFSVQLPDACATAVGSNPNVWLDVFVDGTDTGRTKIGAVPFAVEANHADNATNATNVTGSQAQQFVPSHAIMFFNLAACPAGWSDATSAQGRYVVGMPGAGTLDATVGTALADQENRAVGQHSHTASDLGHTHSATESAHSHGTYTTFSGANLAAGAFQYAGYPQGTPQNTGSTTSVTATVTVGTGNANISVANSGAVAGTNAPYIQFRVCEKN